MLAVFCLLIGQIEKTIFTRKGLVMLIGLADKNDFDRRVRQVTYEKRKSLWWMRARRSHACRPATL